MEMMQVEESVLGVGVMKWFSFSDGVMVVRLRRVDGESVLVLDGDGACVGGDDWWYRCVGGLGSVHFSEWVGDVGLLLSSMEFIGDVLRDEEGADMLKTYFLTEIGAELRKAWFRAIVLLEESGEDISDGLPRGVEKFWWDLSALKGFHLGLMDMYVSEVKDRLDHVLGLAGVNEGVVVLGDKLRSRFGYGGVSEAFRHMWLWLATGGLNMLMWHALDFALHFRFVGEWSFVRYHAKLKSLLGDGVGVEPCAGLLNDCVYDAAPVVEMFVKSGYRPVRYASNSWIYSDSSFAVELREWMARMNELLWLSFRRDLFLTLSSLKEKGAFDGGHDGDE